MSFSSIINNQYVNKTQFEETKLLSKCIDVLKTTNSDGWNCKCERTTVESIRFFDQCRCYKLFNEDSDYVRILPFLVCGMKTYQKNTRIRSMWKYEEQETYRKAGHGRPLCNIFSVIISKNRKRIEFVSLSLISLYHEYNRHAQNKECGD